MRLKGFLSLVLIAAITGCGSSDDDPGDSAGNQTNDTAPPVITIQGDSPLTVSFDTQFIDPGATANDVVNGSVAVISSGSVDTAALGTYTITYTATDGAGNTQTATRTVIVVDDTAPTITLVSDAVFAIQIGQEFRDPGAEATDDYDGALEVDVSGDTPDTDVVGDYAIVYSATDSSGNTDMTDRIVRVTPTQRRIEVSFFGEGQIASSDVAFDCKERSCYVDVDDGTTVSVAADPSTTWEFLRWGGCDTTADNECTITATSDRLVDASFKRIDPVLYKPAVVQLSEDQIHSILDYSAESGAITFAAGTDVSSFAPGVILVSAGIYVGPNDPDNVEIYFARRITQVIALTGSVVFVDTAEATLSDVVESGTVTFDTSGLAIDPASLPRGVTILSGGVVGPNAVDVTVFSIDLVLYDADGNHDTTNDQIRAVGTTDLDLDLDAALDFTFFSGIEEFRWIQRADWTNDVTLEVGNLAVVKGELVVPPTIRLTPIFYGPIVFVPQLQMNLGFDVNLELDLDPTLGATTSFDGGVHYLRSVGWDVFADFETDASATVNWSALSDPLGGKRLVGEAGPELAFSLLAFGVAGPEMSLEAYAGFEAYEALNCPSLFDYETYFGGRGNIGGRLSVFGWQLAYEATLFEVSKVLGNSRCDEDVAPETPLDLVATEVTFDSVTLTWDYPDDHDGLSYRMFRNFRELADDIRGTSFVDVMVEPETEYCYYVAAINPHGTASDASDAECVITPGLDDQPPFAPVGLTADVESSTAITLSWSLPESTDVTTYLIHEHLSDTRLAVGSTAVSPVTITRRLPETEYCFDVTAVDAAGNESAASNIACATTNAADLAEWTFFVACQGLDYQVEEQMDLDIAFTSSVSVLGEGIDYDGTPLAYTLSGVYAADSGDLDGEIIWSFEGSSLRRRDLFAVNLAAGDSGDVNMDQVEITGCDALIRFVSSSSSTTTPSTTTTTSNTGEAFGPSGIQKSIVR